MGARTESGIRAKEFRVVGKAGVDGNGLYLRQLRIYRETIKIRDGAAGSKAAVSAFVDGLIAKAENSRYAKD